MADGAWLLIAVGGIVGVSSLAMILTGAAKDWRWLRWPLAAGIVLLATASSITDPWPDGLGASVCETVANPALVNDPGATPLILETCSDLTVTAVPLLLSITLALILIGPEVAEVGVPGFFTLKAKVQQQEKLVDAQSSEISSLSYQVASIATSSSLSQSGASANVVVKLMNSLRRGEDSGLATDTAAHLAGHLLRSLKADLVNVLGLESVDIAVYRQVPSDGVLREFQNSGPSLTDFSPGFGATGQSFRSRETIVVTGPAVANADYGLNTAQQAHFAQITIVGATPLWAVDDLSRPIGVVTCTSSAGLGDADSEATTKANWKLTLEQHAPSFALYLSMFGYDTAT